MPSKRPTPDPDLADHYDLRRSVPSPYARRYAEAVVPRVDQSDRDAPTPSARRRSRKPFIHFLLTYDLRTGHLEVREFDDPDEATRAYGEAERGHLDDRDLEIVLVGSDSLETVKQTHGHYFSDAARVTLPELIGN